MRAPALAALLLSTAALAAERDFPLTWTTSTLAANQNFLEAWLTPRVGREDGDYVKSEVRLMWSRGVLASTDTQLSADLDFEEGAVTPHLSSLWRYAPLKSTGRVGFGTIARLSLGFDAADLELRFVVDKKLGDVLLALNAAVVRTQFWSGRAGIDTRLDESLAARYALGERASFGLELRVKSAFLGGDYQGTALYVGPSLSFSASRFWVSLGLTSQVAADKAPADRGNGEPATLRDDERFVGRVVFGVRAD